MVRHAGAVQNECFSQRGLAGGKPFGYLTTSRADPLGLQDVDHHHAPDARVGARKQNIASVSAAQAAQAYLKHLRGWCRYVASQWSYLYPKDPRSYPSFCFILLSFIPCSFLNENLFACGTST